MPHGMGDRGSISAEYALIAVGVAVTVALAISAFGQRVAPLININ